MRMRTVAHVLSDFANPGAVVVIMRTEYIQVFCVHLRQLLEDSVFEILVPLLLLPLAP